MFVCYCSEYSWVRSLLASLQSHSLRIKTTWPLLENKSKRGLTTSFHYYCCTFSCYNLNCFTFCFLLTDFIFIFFWSYTIFIAIYHCCGKCLIFVAFILDFYDIHNVIYNNYIYNDIYIHINSPHVNIYTHLIPAAVSCLFPFLLCIAF